MSRLFLSMLLATLVVTVAGCKHANRRQAPAISSHVPGATFTPPPPPSPGFATPPGNLNIAPPPGTVFPNQVPQPGFANPPGNNITPPPGTILPNQAPPPGFPNPPPPAPPVPSIQATPPTQAQWRAAPEIRPIEARTAEPRIQLAAPEPLFGEAPARPTEPPVFSEKRSRSALPAGIPQFAKATDNVYAGLRPSIDDGLDWLAASGYRTVLHVHAPGETIDADRKQVERLGLRYVALEVSPQTLTKVKIDEFTALVREVARQPLFVYDQDGSLAGPLWYLFFRTVENHADDVARIRAGALGLREDRDGNHRLMWLAVQKYLEANP